MRHKRVYNKLDLVSTLDAARQEASVTGRDYYVYIGIEGWLIGVEPPRAPARSYKVSDCKITIPELPSRT